MIAVTMVELIQAINSLSVAGSIVLCVALLCLTLVVIVLIVSLFSY